MIINSQESTRICSGGRAIAEMIKLYEPGPIFGMGGFQMLPFYEGARQLGMRHILINDERAGAFAADAYARATGRPGLCDATLGPGATNLVTALVESLNAGIPIVALVGDTHRSHSWKNMTQETRQEELLRPAVKEYLRVEDIARIPELVRRAFSVATSGRPGPVVLAVPEDIAHAEHHFAAADFWADQRATRVPSTRSSPAPDAVQDAVAVLEGAQRPVILAGGGVHLADAYAELAALAETLNAPVAHTLSGKGALSCLDDRSIGLFGRYSRFANEIIDSADALVVVGSKLGEIATKRYTIPRAGIPIVHLDNTAEELGRYTKIDVALWGDAKEGLSRLHEALSDRVPPQRTSFWQEIAERRTAWEREAEPRYASADSPVHMARLINEMNILLPPEAVVVADGGFASHWTGLLYNTKQAGRGYISDRGFASIGYGLPGAMGAFLAGRSPVIGLTGDGGFNMTVGELETAVREKMEFVLLVVNNAASGYVKALQHAVYGPGSYESSDLSELNYARIAEAYGCLGIRVDDPGQLAGALTRALAERGRPVVIDVAVTRDPAQMLPAVDSRTLKVEAGDRPA
ncbi:thiamine pyrophosphate-binding protein [Microbispora bryophytorum]|uniref:thiamine pyrophosphate-binding protein n=1 Tax=Microbispora bryophytorum TaxID=1460882 RepID=UPI00371E7FA9